MISPYQTTITTAIFGKNNIITTGAGKICCIGGWIKISGPFYSSRNIYIAGGINSNSTTVVITGTAKAFNPNKRSVSTAVLSKEYITAAIIEKMVYAGRVKINRAFKITDYKYIAILI